MPSDTKQRLYEGLFLLNQEAVSSDFGGCVEFLKHVFERAEAELLVLKKWDERRLAYEIKGQRRGTFLLAYFNARGAQIANIERDCELSEQVVRAMIIRADHVGEEELQLAARDADLAVETSLRAGPAEPESAEADTAETSEPEPQAETTEAGAPPRTGDTEQTSS